MNKAKLSALCAKARGWPATAIIENKTFGCPPGELPADDNAWMEVPNYIDDANQADDLLEYVAFNLGCSWSCGYNILSSEYWCEIPTAKDVFCENNRTQNLAKILCALRASPNVPADELERAMGEK